MESDDQYVVFISCFKAKVMRFSSTAQILNDSATVPTTMKEVERSQSAPGHVKLPRVEIEKYEGNPKQ